MNKNFDLGRFKAVALENSKILAGLGGGLLLLVLVFLPTVGALAPTFNQLSNDKNTLADLKSQSQKINNYVSLQQPLKSTATLVDQALPDAGNIPDLMTQIQSIASGSAVTLRSLQFGGSTGGSKGSFQTISLQAVFEGSYAGISSLLKNLESTSRLIGVSSISFDAQKDPNDVSSTFVITAYYLPVAVSPAVDQATLDFQSPATQKVLNFLKNLTPYTPQTTSVDVGKSNPFQ
ncbi:MAG: type II secretion system protein M [Patescibacteria group bacterium]|nr:type II secretion system protein M [Patescibacteria group bacterium]